MIQKRRNTYIAIELSILIACILYALLFRSQLDWKEVDTETIDRLIVVGVDDDWWTGEEKSNYIEFDSFDKMVENSDLIVKASPTGKQTLDNGCFLTEVYVTQCYKGKLATNYIYVYEPVDIYEYNNELAYSTPCGYILMQSNHDYYLFLQPYQQPKGYIYSDVEANSYLLVNQSFGKYPDKITEQKKTVQFPVDFGSIKGNNLLFASGQIYESYLEWFESCLNKYSGA